MTKNTKNKTPFFPKFHIKTLSQKRRTQQQILREKRETLQRNSFHQLERMLKGFLPESLLDQNESGLNSRDRFFTKKNTFFAFLGQVLSEDGSCQEVVHRLREQAQKQGCTTRPSAKTPAYTAARKRLDEGELAAAFYHGARKIESDATFTFGRPLIAIDGTTFSMPDTPKLQEAWPQSGEQKEGLGFPMLKMLGAFSVDTGMLIDCELGNKHDHEIALLRKMNKSLVSGDILAMDRAFCSYCDMADFKQRGIDVVVRQHQMRKEIPDCAAIKIISAEDRWVEWTKPKKRFSHISEEQWMEIPETLQVRQITFQVEVPGFRSRKIILNTTLSEEEFSTEDIAEMYRMRWMAEVSFRNLKQSLNSDILRCKSPEMIKKELWMNLIGYNALCYLQLKAAKSQGVEQSRMSFKSCLQVVRVWENRFRDWQESAEGLLKSMYENMVEYLLPHRPNRVEPRVNKRRPKIIRLMMKPREVLKREILESFPGAQPLKCPLS